MFEIVVKDGKLREWRPPVGNETHFCPSKNAFTASAKALENGVDM